MAPLPVQLFQHGAAPSADRIRPIRNNPPHGQPLGGIWTATYTPPTGSSFVAYGAGGWARQRAWVQTWPDNNSPIPLFNAVMDRRWWLLAPDPAARVYQVDSYADCCALWAAYSFTTPDGARYVDWEAAARDWDAVHLTTQAAGGAYGTPAYVPWVHREADRTRPHMPAWGFEATLWLRWCFTTVTALGLPAWATVITFPPTDRDMAVTALDVLLWRIANGIPVADAYIYQAATVDDLTALFIHTRRAEDPALALAERLAARDQMRRLLATLEYRANPAAAYKSWQASAAGR